eukprot:59434-Chlamydomonas_euryale.AAC.1
MPSTRAFPCLSSPAQWKQTSERCTKKVLPSEAICLVASSPNKAIALTPGGEGLLRVGGSQCNSNSYSYRNRNSCSNSNSDAAKQAGPFPGREHFPGLAGACQRREAMRGRVDVWMYVGRCRRTLPSQTPAASCRPF